MRRDKLFAYYDCVGEHVCGAFLHECRVYIALDNGSVDNGDGGSGDVANNNCVVFELSLAADLHISLYPAVKVKVLGVNITQQNAVVIHLHLSLGGDAALHLSAITALLHSMLPTTLPETEIFFVSLISP